MPDEPDSFEGLPPLRPVKIGRRPRTKNQGVRLDGVNENLINFAAEEDAVVTSGRDAPGVHMPGSKHGDGGALDLRTRDRTPEQIRGMQERARARGLNATYERAGQGRATGDHLHLSIGRQRPPRRPQAQPEPDSFEGLPQMEEPDSFEGLPPAPISQDVSRATPQVTSQVQAPSQIPAPVPPPSVTANRPELPPVSLAPPGARESASPAPNTPAVSSSTSTTPQPAVTEGVSEPGGATPAVPPVKFPALDRPGYADTLHDIIAARGLQGPEQLAAYLKWMEQASAYGDLADPSFRAQIVSGNVQGPRVGAQLGVAAARAPRRVTGGGIQEVPTAQPGQVTPNVARDTATLQPNIAGDTRPTAPVQQQPGTGAVQVAANAGSTAESLAVSAFEVLGRQSGLDGINANLFARDAAEALRVRNGGRYFRGVADEAKFLEDAKRAGGANVRLDAFDAPTLEGLLRAYTGGQQSGQSIEAQMMAETGVIQASTDKERRREQEVRAEVEKEVAAEQQAQPAMTPEGVPSPDPSREVAARENYEREVQTRTNQRLAMERIHSQLSDLVIDRPRLVKEMRKAVEGRMEEFASGRGGKAGQEYGAGMLGAGTLPGRQMSALDRMAEEEADALIKDIEYAKRSTDPNVAVGVVASVYQRVRRNPFVLLPVLSTLTDLDNTRNASAAQERIGAAQTAGRAPEQRDVLTVQAHQAAQHVNQTAYADIANLIVEQPAFWGEFAMMGPATGAIESAVGRGLARVGIRGLEESAEIGAGALRSRLGARVLGAEALAGTSRSIAERSAYKVGEIISKMVQTTVAGGAMTGTVGIPRVSQEYLERRMKGEDGPTAFVHSVFNQWGEYVSEFQGDVAELLPGMKRLNDLLRPVMQNFEKMGYHGIAGEIYEEAWKDFIWTPATALSAEERRQAFAEAQERWSDPRTWGVMVVGFALPGVGRALAGHAGTALKQMRGEYGDNVAQIESRIAELQTQAPSEETTAQIAEAEEERQHYTGLIEQINAHEQEIAKQEAEVSATEAAVSATEAAASAQEQQPEAVDVTTATPAPSPTVESGTAEPATAEPATAASPRSEAEDFADEIMRELMGESGGQSSQVDEHGFRQFPEDRGSLGVPRAQMPQVKAEHRGALVNYLAARGIEHEEMMVRPSSLKPTQAEYSPGKVEKAREYQGGNRAILVSGDGYVLDGQHQLEQAYEDAPETPYRVIVLHGDAKELLPLIHDFPSSTVNKESEGGPKESPTTAESFADEVMRELTGSGAESMPEDAGQPGGSYRVRRAGLSPETFAVFDAANNPVMGGFTSREEAQGFADSLTGSGPTATVDQILSPEHSSNVLATKGGAAPSEEERGPGRADSSFEGSVPAPADSAKAPNMSPSTPAMQPAGGPLSSEREAIRAEREEIKRRLKEARRKRMQAVGADPDKGEELRHGGPALPSREEVIETARLLQTYAKEGTLIFKEAVRRFVEDMDADADYARELGKAFEVGWRLLKKQGFNVDEPGSVEEAITELEGAQDERDESTDNAGGSERDLRDTEETAGEDQSEAKAEEDEYVSPDPLEAQDPDPPRVRLGRKFARAFLEGRQFSSITHARKFASEGRPKIEAGTQEAKDVDEAVEIGVGIAAREMVARQRAEGKTDEEIYQRLVNLYTQQQPNLSVRTSTSALEQAYSTPAPLAFIASRLAGINRRTSVLGNTAGNGMLFIEAAPETIVANEKNASRFAALEALFPLADIRQGDALKLQTDQKFDRYIENPPFGVVKENGESKTFEPLPGYKTNEIDHAIAFAGLSHLADNGRAVLIVGSVQNEADRKKRADQYDAKAKRLFYYHLYRNYNVADHFTVSGDLYERQGAGWPVDVIVIDGRGKSERKLPAADPPRVYKTWDDLAEVLQNEYVEPEVSGVDAGDRPQGADRPARRGGADTGGAGTAGHGDVSGVSGRPGKEDVGTGAQLGNSPRGDGEGSMVGRVTNESVEMVESGNGSAVSSTRPGITDAARGDERAGQIAEKDLRGQPGSAEDRGGDDARDVDERRPQPPEREKVDTTQTQVSYMPASQARGMATLTPVNMATAAQDALDALIKRLGGVRGDDTLDRFVADRLGYKPQQIAEYFGAEQVDAIALAIDNIERGAGYIAGDQTGIGKGRQVAAILRYARRKGFTPMFITEKPNLYKDMARDLQDIGEGTLDELRDRILMTNAAQTVPLNDDEENPIVLRTPDAKTHNERLRAVASSGTLPDGVDYVFTTYSQMQKIGGITARQEFLDAMAANAVIVFDESHNAGGTEASGWGQKKDAATGGQDPLSRAGFARGLIGSAQGVFYSSATFAKRPSVMDLYSKTDMHLSVSNTPLADMIAKGGVPLQQIVSSMLVESGQMLRRERSFEGIEYATALAPVDQESAETVSSVMNVVFQFDKVKKEVLAGIQEVIRENAEAIGVDPATGAVSASSTSFSSLIHNLVDQMLLSLKMEAAIETALESLRAGEKPVITVAFTMGSFLQQYAEEFGLQTGEAVGLNFGDMMKRYLDRTREVTYKRPDGTKYRERLTDEQLGPQGVALYNEAVEMIQAADWSKMPVSPIDYIKYRIEAETSKETGRHYVVGEITGRSYALDYSEHFRTKGEAPPAFRRRSQKDKSIKGRIRQIVGFNEGSIDVMILNQAGSTGLSLHASERVSDRRPRHMIVAQPERNIDTHMQLLGRVNRTGQVMLPRYTQLVADIPSEKRPAAVLAKKMASLNANTTAARGSKFKAESVVDFMNQYGDQVALALMENNPDLHERLGEPLMTAEGLSSEDAARKVTGRLPILTLAEATAIYDELEQEYNDLIERVNALGENALEAQTMALDAKTLKTTTVFEGQGGRPFERGAVAEEMDVKRLRKPYSTAQVVDLVAQTLVKRFAELKAAEEVPEVENTTEGLRRLAMAGEWLQGYQREALQEEVKDYLAKELETVVATPRKDEEQEEADSRAEQRRRMTETRVGEVLGRWNQVHERYHVGQTVQVVNGATGDMYGVITDIHRNGRSANPATLGAWKLTIALADAARSVNIPFSKVRISTATDEGRDAAGEYDVTETEEASVFDMSALKRVTLPVLDAFERGQSVSRERRIIITGNIFAGFGRFEKSRGQIINFTDDSGNLRQGILMPKDFDVEKALDQEPVIFKDAKQIIEFLQTTPGLVTTPDGHFKIVKQGANDFKFTAPRAKGAGRQYWGNTKLLDAAGQDFVTKGDVMVLVAQGDKRASKIIEAALLQGWTLQTQTHKERAREITGTKPKGGASEAGGYASPRRTESASAEEAEPGDLTSSRAGGRPSLTAQREPVADVESFQVSQRVRQVLENLGLPVAEKSLSHRLLGVYKLREYKVRVQSLFDVFTAAHEAMHGISVEEEIGQRVINDTKRGDRLRSRLTDIYEEFYPNAKRTHALRRRVEEGLAVLAERYLLDPADTRARYGDLVSTFIAPTGQYYSPRTTQLLDELANLVGGYARMTAAQRIGGRIASGREVARRDAGYSVTERMRKNFLNAMEPLERYARRQGVRYTSDDPMTAYFGLLGRGSLVHGWIEGRKLAVLQKDGTYDLRDGSVKTYLRMVKKAKGALSAASAMGAHYENDAVGLKPFDIFLVARRVVADHNRRAELLAEAQDPLTDPERAAEAIEEAEDLRQTLEKDDFNLQDAVEVVSEFGPVYADAARVYDSINKALAEFAENAGLIDAEYAHKLKTSQGYAAFVRKVYDENQSDYSSTHGTANSQSKVRTFKARSGSTLDIISPTFTQMTSIAEILGKGLQNRLWNKVLELGESDREMARRFEVIPTERGFERGRITYPQLKNSELIHILVNGEHVFVKPGQEFADVAARLRPQELDLFAKWIKAPSSFFTRLTTSANPFWALGNLTIDQITAAMNTKTGFKPLYDPAKSLVHYVEWLAGNAYERVTGKKANFKGAEAVERYMELGGKKQTFASQYDLAPEDAVAKVLGGRTLFQHAAGIVDMGLGLLEFPANLSEYLTRYSEFRRSLEGGEADEVAMYRAAEVTVPFQQRGAWAGKMGENWIQTLPYFNALVQVNYKFLRNVREQPARTATVVAALAVSALGGALALLRYLDDDDEARRLFMNMSASELSRAIYLPNPLRKGSLIRIRIPEQVGAVTGLMYLYAIQHYGGQKVKRDELFDALTSPLPEQVDVTDARKMLIAWLPQAVRPAVNAYANRKTYPEIGPIVPKRLEDLPADLQFTDYTSAVGKQFGALLNVSPMKVDYWIRNQFGAVGGMVLGQMPSFPLVRQARETEIAERAYDNFFAQKEAADAQFARLKATAKGDYKHAYSEEERKEIITAATLYEKMGKVLSNVREAQGVRTLPNALKQEVYETLLFFDTSADIGKKASAIEALNRKMLKHAADSGAKIDRSKAVATPEGMERITRESVIDMNINRRREIKLPPPGSK